MAMFKIAVNGVLLLAMLGIGCSGHEVVDRRGCERLRDHLVDVRLHDGSADGVDIDQHRSAMTAALGDSFVDRCEQTMNIEQLHCAMRATALNATAECTRSVVSSN